MIKSDLAALVAERHSMHKNEASAILDTIFESIGSILYDGEEIVIKGFGKFTVEATAVRTGRNPKTGEKIIVPAGGKVKFKSYLDKERIANATYRHN